MTKIFYAQQGNLTNNETGEKYGVIYQGTTRQIEIWDLTYGTDTSPGRTPNRTPDLVIPADSLEEEFFPHDPYKPAKTPLHHLADRQYSIDRNRGTLKHSLIESTTKAKIKHPTFGTQPAQSLNIQIFDTQTYIFNQGRLYAWLVDPEISYETTQPRTRGARNTQKIENDRLEVIIQSIYQDCGCPGLSDAQRLKPHFEEITINPKNVI